MTYVDDLPQETEDQMRRALHHGMRVHVHHGASDGLKTRYVMQSLAKRMPLCLARSQGEMSCNLLVVKVSKNCTHLSGGDGNSEVLVLLEDGHLGALVDDALIDGVGHGEVDDAAEEDAVINLEVIIDDNDLIALERIINRFTLE